MKAKQATLNVKSFYILRSDFKVIYSDNGKDDVFYDGEIDIDFGVHIINEDSFSVVMKISLNHDKTPKAGYSFFVEGYGIFSFNEKISKEQKRMFTSLALNVMVGNIKAYVKNITSSSPYGTYILPLINMQDLIDKKRNVKAN